MKITLDANFKEAQKLIKKRGKDLKASTKKALLITGFKGIEIIQDRTNKRRSYKGGFFKNYTSKYAAYRISKGRGSKPDLQFTGQMFSSMTVASTSREAEIYFTRNSEAKKAAMNDKKRPFFGFSRRERAVLSGVLERNLK